MIKMAYNDDKQCDVTLNKKETGFICSKDMFDAIDGFDDEDLEKPNFPGKHSLAKVPLVLSDPDEIPPVQVPATINQYLRKYQQEGIAFLYKQYSLGKGAILADDMGLGKTVQVIGFISAVLGKTGTKFDIYGKYLQKTDCDKVSTSLVKKENGVFLIVSPHSVLYNWHDELMTWGYFKIGKFHNNKRAETLERAEKNKLDVVLTTYETLRNHWETLNCIQWLALIMDEVHHLKDPKAAVTIASKSIDVKCRIGLTGTPLQNRLLDFWCVLDWANPGCLGKKEDFTDRFGKPIMKGQRFDVTKRELATGRKKTQEFHSMIEDWCLRRTKFLISDQLPHKDQKVVFCPMSKLQEEIYKTLLQENDVQLVLKQGEPCDCRSELSRGQCCYSENEEGCSIKKLMLQYLKLFLKVSNHAALLLPQIKQTEEQRKRATAVCEKVFSAHPDFKAASELPSLQLFSDSNFCGKMKVLDKLLKLFKWQKDKVLLFSYSTQLLDMLEAYVISCGMVYRRLDGKTRGERRLCTVREFNTDPDIFMFLVSTKAGGVGLNLTGANVVIVFDPSWNPANDLQAEDRAYRIGQRRDVKVFRMISSGTVEENIYLRQVYKQQLANVAVEGNNERRYFTAVDGEKDKKGELFGIENLFALRNDGCCVSTDIFKRSDKIERGFKMAKYELLPSERKEVDDKLHFKKSPVLEECEEEEDQRYDLDDVASQFIEEETDVPKNGLECDNQRREEKKYDQALSNNDCEIESSKDCCECLIKDASETQTVKFTKVRNFSEKNNLNKKRSQLPQTEEERKRQKNENTTSLKKTPMSKDSQVNQILVDCGVQHTHSNKLIIGASKAENEMTSRAMKEVFELGECSQQPANCFTAIDSDGEESDDIGDYSEERSLVKSDESKDDSKHSLKTDNDNIKSSSKRVQTEIVIGKVGNSSVLFGETPKAIRLRQFFEMSQAQGYKSEVDLAKVVVSSNTTDRLNLLKEYYKTMHYPTDSVLFYDENVESSSAMKTKHSEATKRTCKIESSLKLSQCRHPRSSSKTSYTKVLKSPIVKTNVIDRLEQNCSESPQVRIKNDISPSSSLPLGPCINSLKKAKSVAGMNISTNIIQTSKREAKVETIEDKEGKSTPDVGNLSANVSLIPEETQDFQFSSFLDEFLYECSQRNHTRSGSDSALSINEYVDGSDSVEKASYRKVHTSVFDDLI